jgi:hypothetical protein
MKRLPLTDFAGK